MPKYILIYPAPPLIPEDSDAIAEPVVDPDDATAIASGDVTTAKWIVENPAGKAVRMTTGDLIAHVSAGSLSIPTFALSTAYPRLGAFVHEGVLYRVLRAIPSTNSAEVDALLGGGAIEALGGGSSGIDRDTAREIAAEAAKARYTDDDQAEVAKIEGIIDRLNDIHPDINFAILNYRNGTPRPPFKSQVEAFQKGLLTIGIGQDGVLWTLKDTPAADAEGVWIDFDTNEWQFEQNSVLPNSALQTGDYYYRYDDDVWVLYDGTKQVVYYDRDISAFLPNHIFLGKFANAENATQSIVGYDGTKTYLAYFTVTVSGRTGREVRQLQSYTPGRQEGITWVSTDETLHHLSDELHKLIQTNVTNITRNKSLIGEEGINIRNNARSIMDLETEQDTQDTLIQRNADAIPEPVTDRDAIRGTTTEGYLNPRQVRLNDLATYSQEASDDPELDTLHIRYAAIDYVQNDYDNGNLGFGQMMFNHSTLASANKIKISYPSRFQTTSAIRAKFDNLVVGDKIELLQVNTGMDYEEPDRVFTSNITAISRVIRSGGNEHSIIELSLDANPSLTVGLGPNTQYFVAVTGKFKDRVIPVIEDADIDNALIVDANKKPVWGARTVAPAAAARSESIYFNEQTNVGTAEVAVTHRTTDPIVVTHGSGDPNLIRTVSSQTSQIEFLKAGIYDIHIEGLINVLGRANSSRVLPRIRFYDTNNNFVAEIDDHYHRVDGRNDQQANNLRVSGDGTITIPSDNFICNIRIAQELLSGGMNFTIQANWSLSVIPFGVQGPRGIQGEIGPPGRQGDPGPMGPTPTAQLWGTSNVFNSIANRRSPVTAFTLSNNVPAGTTTSGSTIVFPATFKGLIWVTGTVNSGTRTTSIVNVHFTATQSEYTNIHFLLNVQLQANLSYDAANDNITFQISNQGAAAVAGSAQITVHGIAF